MPASAFSPSRRLQSLLLAAAAALVLATLTWAGVRLHGVHQENAALTVELTGGRREMRAQRSQEAPLREAALRTEALVREVGRLETALQESKSQTAAAAALPAARETELQELISFLRKENEAARQMIERLEQEKIAKDAKDGRRPAPPARTAAAR